MPVVADAGSDQAIAYASLPTTANLTGNASGGTGPYTWQWTLLKKPTGSSASLSSATAQNPTLNSVDTVGTYRLLLVATDSLSEASEGDPLLAPNSAFVQINVAEQYITTVVKPAPGERDWDSKYGALVTEVNTLRNDFDTQTIAEHSDTTATGAELDTLTDGSDANGLHTHSTTDYTTKAAVSTNGIIQAAETPVDPANPKAVTQDRVSLSGGKAGTLAANDVVGVWACNDAYKVHAINIAVEDSGDTSGSTDVTLYEMTQTQWNNSDFAGATVITSGPSIAQATNAQRTQWTTVPSHTIAASAGTIIAARITAVPSGASSDIWVTVALKLLW